MKIIHTKISCDSLTSRMPGVIPSLINTWNLPAIFNCGEYEASEKFYSYSSAAKRAYEYNVNASELVYGTEFVKFDKNNAIDFVNANYGLIPSDIIIPQSIAHKITDYTDFYVNIPDENGGFYDLSWPKNIDDPHYEGRKIISGGTEVKVLTYSTLNKWYSFFKKYYDLIEHPEYKRVYKSAVDYYEKESGTKNEQLQKEYEDLDTIFNSRGGREMYEWISKNCIVQYNIPEEFVDAWNRTCLYFGEAIKWYYWFNERSEIYKRVWNLEDCKDTEDCCDCAEYLRLGGNDFFWGKDKKSGLKAWVESIELDSSFATNSASITIPISISNSIDDLGEMAIFSNDWQSEVDYHNTLEEKGYELFPGIDGGTIINNPYIINENGDKVPLPESIYMIKNGETRKGYEYNEFYENAFKYDDSSPQGEYESDWTPYTDFYIVNNPNDFASNGIKNGEYVEITGYTVSPINGKIIYNPTKEDVKLVYKQNKHHCTCINGIKYDVIKGKYVQLCYDTDSFANLKYKKHEKLQIFKDGDLEYAILNGKRKYVMLDSNGDERVYFLKDSNCYDDGCKVSKGEYIVFDNCLYLVEDGKITIAEDESKKIYPILDGYFDIDDNRYYLLNNKVVIQNSYEYDETNDTYTFKFRGLNENDLRILGISEFVISDNSIIVYYRYETHKCQIVSGYCDSKLDLLRRKEVTTDDLGNELPGYFRSVVNIDKPGYLQSVYNVPYDNCTLDILFKVGEVSDIYPNNNLKGDNVKYFDGNIITNIRFYYADAFKTPKIVVEANNDNALDAIRECEIKYKNSEDSSIVDILFCEITYHIGAVIEKRQNKYTLSTKYHSGIKYIDTVYVTKRIGTYYLNDNKSFTFNYYFLSQDVNRINLFDFNTSVNWDASTYFEFVPYLYVFDKQEEKIVGLGTYEYYSGWSNNNNIMVTPLFRNEYNLASSTPQNVDADIYIDRGVSAAFEKHLKLQEIRTMEALENLSNSSSVSGFKINTY